MATNYKVLLPAPSDTLVLCSKLTEPPSRAHASQLLRSGHCCLSAAVLVTAMALCRTLDVSENWFSGPMPTNLGGLTAMLYVQACCRDVPSRVMTTVL